MIDYPLKLQRFTEILSVNGRAAYTITGRKYDKVMLQPAPSTAFAPWFFVDRADGSIYGIRSHLAPNLKHWYGTVDTMEEWDWSHLIPTPKNPDNYTYCGRYGPFDRWTAK